MICTARLMGNLKLSSYLSYFRFKREMELEADHDIISDPYIKSVIKMRYKTFLSTNSCSKSCSVLQNINCARTQGFEIIKRFFNLILILRLRSKWRFYKGFQSIFQIVPNEYKLSSKTLTKTFKARFLQWNANSEDGIPVWAWIKFHNIGAWKRLKNSHYNKKC